MAKKQPLPTPQEVFNNTNACITCVYENDCTQQLPFPLNLCEHCEKFEKIEKYLIKG